MTANASPRRQETKSAATRRALIESAVAVISEVGYAATTTSLIAQRAGVSRGAFQHHFKSRNDIIVAVLNEMRSEVNLGLDVDSLANRPLTQRIDAILTHYYVIYGSKLHAAAIQIWLGAWSDTDLRNSVNAGLDDMENSIINAWRRSFPELEINDSSIMAVRHVIISAIRGSTMLEMWYDHKGDWPKHFAVLRDFLLFHFSSGGAGLAPSTNIPTTAGSIDGIQINNVRGR